MRSSKGKRVLLLSGPNGPFFRRLYDELKQGGAIVDKVTVSAAEALYFVGRPTIAFRGALLDWPAFLEELVRRNSYEVCFLFGDCRPYHASARPILNKNGVRVFVFEDGYLRPDYITVEVEGVNGRSTIKTTRPNLEALPQALEEPTPVQGAFGWSVLHTIVNSLAVTLGAPLYPKYRHHRDVNTIRQAYLWARSGIRYAYFRMRERRALQLFQGPLSGKYFLAGLQVHNDYQVKSSRFSDVSDFIREVMASFSAHAPRDASLVFKHHPADRAYRDYGRMIQALSTEYGLGERVLYVHDCHLPTLLKHARGTVVINSTIGWSSLHHRTPVMALDETVYGFFGLSAEGSLDDFWKEQAPVDVAAVHAATTWLRLNNQANGSVWTKIPGGGPSGVIWPENFTLEG